jgi:putative FmdB family regulatory protein
MPRYDYHCPACGIVIEVTHSIRETPEVRCPTCDNIMHRLLSGGEAIAVEKGTLPSNIQRAVDAKAARDMDHAKKTVEWIERVGKPTTRAGLNRPWPKPPKE